MLQLFKMSKGGHRLVEKVKLLQKIVIKHGDQILLVRRASNTFYRPGAWDLPGGNAEWPEVSDDQPDIHKLDAVRELEEETGIVVDPSTIGEKPIYFGSYFEAKRELYTIIVGWKLELPVGFDLNSVEISDEHTEFQWVKLARVDEYDFAFAGDSNGFIGKMLKNV